MDQHSRRRPQASNTQEELPFLCASAVRDGAWQHALEHEDLRLDAEGGQPRRPPVLLRRGWISLGKNSFRSIITEHTDTGTLQTLT